MSRILKKCNNQITQNYVKGKHDGIDIVGYKNKSDYITAHTKGTVILVQTGYKNNKNSIGNATWGNRVMIKHDNGYYTHYCHLKSVSVGIGDKVNAGTVIGYMGNSGNAYGVHLHFELYKGGTSASKRINPTSYINSNLPKGTNIAGANYYRAYDNKKNIWLPSVKMGTNSYAGNLGNGISAFKVDNLTYRAHDKVKRKWLPWVTGNNDYAGNLPNDIDAIQIKNVTYRVYDNKKKKWLPWVIGTTDYAGNIGNSIGGIQIK